MGPAIFVVSVIYTELNSRLLMEFVLTFFCGFDGLRAFLRGNKVKRSKTERGIKNHPPRGIRGLKLNALIFHKIILCRVSRIFSFSNYNLVATSDRQISIIFLRWSIRGEFYFLFHRRAKGIFLLISITLCAGKLVINDLQVGNTKLNIQRNSTKRKRMKNSLTFG